MQTVVLHRDKTVAITILYKCNFLSKTERCQCYHDNQSAAAPKDACTDSAQHDAKLEHHIHDASSTKRKKINGRSGRYV
jgi:hypothetical protein